MIPSSMKFENIAFALRASEKAVRQYGKHVEVEMWHGVSTAGKPDLVSIEVQDVCWSAPMTRYTDNLDLLAQDVQPNLPWADEHFLERVSGEPLNPGEQYKNWPWYREGSAWDKEFRDSGGKFSHTYMERMWSPATHDGQLEDVVDLLIREPFTRQAYLPIWFPQDTGNIHGWRVPCTLGYHFMLRQNCLHLWYTIRSCDIIRYLRDDVYMAIRLADWMLRQCLMANDAMEQGADPNPWQRGVKLGTFTFHAFSLHMFEGDRYVNPQ